MSACISFVGLWFPRLFVLFLYPLCFPLCEYLLIFMASINFCLVVNGGFPVTCNIVTCYVLGNGPFFIFGSLLFTVLCLRFAYFTFTLFMGWYDFAVCFLSLVVVLCHWVGIFGFSPDSETFCCFLVFCQELYLPCSGFRFSSGYYFAVRISRLCGFPLASSDVFLPLF